MDCVKINYFELDLLQLLSDENIFAFQFILVEQQSLNPHLLRFVYDPPTEEQGESVFETWSLDFVKRLVDFGQQISATYSLWEPDCIYLCNQSNNVCLTYLLYLTFCLMHEPFKSLSDIENEMQKTHDYTVTCWPDIVRKYVLPKLTQCINEMNCSSRNSSCDQISQYSI